jgi:hypothetical protein
MLGTEKGRDGNVMVRDHATQPNRDSISPHDNAVIRRRCRAHQSWTAECPPITSSAAVAVRPAGTRMPLPSRQRRLTSMSQTSDRVTGGPS